MDDERLPPGCHGIRALSCVLRRVCLAGEPVDCTVRVGAARKSSPCGVIRIGKREKVRPARQKWPVFGVFGLAGRVFSRFGQNEAAVGRTFSRGDGWRAAVGRTFSRFGRGGTIQVVLCVRTGPEMRVDWSLTVGSARKSSPCGVIRIGKREKVPPARQKWPVFGVFGLAGRVFSRFGQNEAAVGRTFSRFGLDGAVVGRTFSRGDAMGRCWANFFAL